MHTCKTKPVFDMKDAGMLTSCVSMADFLIPLYEDPMRFFDGAGINLGETNAKLYGYTKHSCLSHWATARYIHVTSPRYWKIFLGQKLSLRPVPTPDPQFCGPNFCCPYDSAAPCLQNVKSCPPPPVPYANAGSAPESNSITCSSVN